METKQLVQLRRLLDAKPGQTMLFYYSPEFGTNEWQFVKVKNIVGKYIYATGIDNDQLMSYQSRLASKVHLISLENQEVISLPDARKILLSKTRMTFNLDEFNSDGISFLLKQYDRTIEEAKYVECVDSVVITRKLPATPFNRLKGSTTYLAGAIDLCPNGGKAWRDEITPKLKELGVTVYNPLEKPINIGLEDDDNRSSRQLLKESGQFDEFRKIMKAIRHADLRMIDKSDFMVVYLDLEVFACGTIEEISWCNKTKKPVIVFCKQGKLAIPDWIFGMLPHQLLFDTVDDVMDYLEHINSDEVIDDLGRWLFFH